MGIMNKHSELEKASSLLLQALKIIGNFSDSNAIEARHHIRRATEKINILQRSKEKKSQSTQTEYQKWWGHVQAGVASMPMSREAHMKTLAQINAMINQEEQKLAELEKQSAETPVPNELLQD